MADAEQVAILKQGVEAWNGWRGNHRAVRVDLSEARFSNARLSAVDLEEVDLTKAVLAGANLVGANLSGASLYKADLSEADLGGACLHKTDLRFADASKANFDGADLSAANLTDADLSWAILSGANMSEAHLFFVDLNGADLRNANFSRANANGSLFVDNDLASTKGLDSIKHWGPSKIGIDTIYKSRGKISETFLRGAGVPESFITYMKSLAGTAIEFYSCFISYSTKDQEFAERLYGDLQANNVRCWFAPHDIRGGKKIHEQIDEAIRMHDKLLLILSPDSIRSAWVETEIAKARKRETRDERRVLFPVRLVDFETLKNWECFDADTGKDSAREIREYFIPDFSDWKNHDSYQMGFQRLLKDLKAG